MKKMITSRRVCLIGKIKGLTEASRTTRKMMNATEDDDKFYRLYNVKRDIRSDARHHHLAYAYLRGIPYRVLEKKCNEKPDIDKIYIVAMAHSWHISFVYREEQLKKIKEWLNAEEVKPVEVKQTVGVVKSIKTFLGIGGANVVEQP
jgi:hypothetical protein